MDSYQPKYENPAITLPFIADKHRHKGYKFYDFDDGQKLSVETGNDPIFNNWKNDAIRMANAKVQSTLSSQDRLLQPKHPRIQPYNRSGQPFFSNIDQSNKNMYSSVYGGGNTTYSARLSDADRDARRKKILERLGDNYVKYKAGDTSEDVRQPSILNQSDSAKLEAKLLLESISNRIYNEDFDFGLFSDIYKYIQFLVKNISTFDNFQEFKDLLDRFENLKDIMENIVEEENLTDEATKYTSAIRDVLSGIVDYIKYNVRGIGSNQKQREIIAKSGVNKINLTKVEKLLQKSRLGRQSLDELKAQQEREREQQRLLEQADEEVSFIDTATTSNNSGTTATSSTSSSGFSIPPWLFPEESVASSATQQAPTIVPSEAQSSSASAEQLTRRSFDGLNRDEVIALANQYLQPPYNPDPSTKLQRVKTYIYKRLNI